MDSIETFLLQNVYGSSQEGFEIELIRLTRLLLGYIKTIQVLREHSMLVRANQKKMALKVKVNLDLLLMNMNSI